MAAFNVQVLPSIATGYDARLDSDNCVDCRVIIQEKLDGSQLTISNINGVVTFFNKSKQISGKSKPFLNSYLSLVNKPHIFKSGYFYHGEAMISIKPHTIVYEREAKYFWVLYEVVRADNTSLVPEEIYELIKDTGIEYLPPLYDNKQETEYIDYIQIAKRLMEDITTGEITSHLGGTPEGVVLKALNRTRDIKSVNTRYKFVRQELAEMNSKKKKRIPRVSDEQIIEAIGKIYDTEARMRKGVQHLQEEDKWNYNDPKKNISSLVDELDLDLLSEAEDDIKSMLFIRFFPKISKIARSSLFRG